MADEKAMAARSQARGQIAAQIKDPNERRKFIAYQGKRESEERRKGGDATRMAADAEERVGRDVDSNTYREGNRVAVQGSMKRGGKAKRSGVYRLHRGEKIRKGKRGKRGRE